MHPPGSQSLVAGIHPLGMSCWDLWNLYTSSSCHLIFYHNCAGKPFGYATSLIMPTLSSLLTSAFTHSALSLDIFWSFCFLGLMLGSTLSACSMILLSTPHRSFADQAKTSLLRDRNLLRLYSCFEDNCEPKKTLFWPHLHIGELVLVDPQNLLFL